MKKLSLYIFLVLMWCNVGVAEKILLTNCNSNVPHDINIMGEKLPFWGVDIDTTNAIAGELRRYPQWMDTEVRTIIYLTDRVNDKIYGYGLAYMTGIWEYEFNLKEPNFIVNALHSFPNDERIKRIPKTDEFMQELQTMMLYDKEEPLTYKVECTKE